MKDPLLNVKKDDRVEILTCGRTCKHGGKLGSVFVVYPFGSLGVVLDDGGWCYTVKTFKKVQESKTYEFNQCQNN